MSPFCPASSLCPTLPYKNGSCQEHHGDLLLVELSGERTPEAPIGFLTLPSDVCTVHLALIAGESRINGYW